MPFDPNSISPEQLEYARRLQAGLASTDPMGGATADARGAIDATLQDAAAGRYQAPPTATDAVPMAAPPPAANDVESRIQSQLGAGPAQPVDVGGRFSVSGNTPPAAPVPMVPATPAKDSGVPYVWGPNAAGNGLAEEAARLGITVGPKAEQVAPEPDAAPPQPPAQGGGGGGGYAPARMDPGGPRVAGWNVTESRGPQTPYELRQAYSDSMGQMQDAGRKQAEIEAQRAEFNAGVARDNAEAERRFLAEQARIRQAADKAAATDRVQGPAEQLGAGGVIAAAILMGIGEYAARRPGGSGVNTAMNLINSSIDKEMQRQAKAIDIRRMGREEQALRLANMRSSYYEVMKQKVAAKAAELGTEEAAINGQKLIAQLDLEHNKYETDAARAALGSTQVATSIQNVAPRMVGGGGPAKPKSEQRDLMIPGYGVAPNAKSADEGTKMVAATNHLLGLIKDVKEASATLGDRITPEKRAYVASKKASIVVAIKNAEQMGALDKGTQEIAADLIGSPESVVDLGGRTAGLEALGDTVQKNIKHRMDSMGVAPATQSVQQGPTGPRVAVNLTGAQPRKPKTGEQVSSFRAPGSK